MGGERTEYRFDDDTHYVLGRLQGARIRPVVPLFRKNGIYADPLDTEAFGRYCSMGCEVSEVRWRRIRSGTSLPTSMFESTTVAQEWPRQCQVSK